MEGSTVGQQYNKNICMMTSHRGSLHAEHDESVRSLSLFVLSWKNEHIEIHEEGVVSSQGKTNNFFIPCRHGVVADVDGWPIRVAAFSKTSLVVCLDEPFRHFWSQWKMWKKRTIWREIDKKPSFLIEGRSLMTTGFLWESWQDESWMFSMMF